MAMVIILDNWLFERCLLGVHLSAQTTFLLSGGISEGLQQLKSRYVEFRVVVAD
jgi:hypothetical protein